jgi:broad specificity phosphatase PhoE
MNVPGPVTLLLVRHAETDDNVAARLSGWTDSHLSTRGLRQVQILADHFNAAHGDVAAIYASPLNRARLTAEAIAALTGHDLIVDPDLREMHFGELEARTIEEIRASHGYLLALDDDPSVEEFSWPGGESRLGFASRVDVTVERISRVHSGQTIALVTHGGFISTFLARVHGEPPGAWRQWLVSNASLTEVEWEPTTGRGRVLRRGDDAHLADLRAEEQGGA